MSGRTITVPDEVRRALEGWPEVGAWDQMFALLTVDSEGFPHVCLLSRAELQADANEVRAVIASTNTAANLRRTGRATLIVIGPEAGWYCKLRLLCSEAGEDSLLAASFQVASIKRDAAGVALEPPRFMPTAALPIEENWERSRRMLAALPTGRHDN
jgi:Pyridoxamine 5'-phosphate oxidase